MRHLLKNFALGFCVLFGLYALPTLAETPEQEIEHAQQLENQANDLQFSGKYQKAIPLYQQSLEIRERILGPYATPTFAGVVSLAFVYETMGQYEQALPLLKRAIEISEKSPDPDLRAGVSFNYEALARVYLTIGKYEQALPLYQHVLELKEKDFGLDYPSLTVSPMEKLAELYQILGQYEKALTLIQRALAIREKEDPSSFNTSISLNDLADLYQSMGQIEKARPLYQRTLEIKKRLVDDPKGNCHTPDTFCAASMNNLATIYVALGQYEQALPLYQRSLEIHEAQEDIDPANTVTSFNNLGGLHITLGQYEKALPLFHRAYFILQTAHVPNSLKVVQVNLANIYEKQGNDSVAIFYLKGAVNTMQSIRSSSRGLDKELQFSLLKKNGNIYTHLADLLVSAGRIAEAQQVLSMLKEDEYFEFIRRDANADNRNSRLSLNAAERVYSDKLKAVGNKSAKLVEQLSVLNKQAKAGLTPSQEKHRTRIKVELGEKSKQIIALLKELTLRPPALQPQQVEVGNENPDQLRTMLNTLGHGAVVLQYLVADKRVVVILTTTKTRIVRESPISSADLGRMIREYSQVVQNPARDPRPLGYELYQLLIAPVADDLKQANAQTLMLSLNGSLRYLPMSALYDGNAYLAERFPLAIFTEASRDKLNKSPDALWKVAALGLTQQVGDFKALPSVKQELSGIVKGKFLDFSDGVLPGDIYLDQDFTQARLHQVLDHDYSVVHIASHFYFSPASDAQSYLVLGDGNQVSLADIRTGDWKFNSVDLLTLSACETGLGGGQDANGREIEGFGVLAQRQGAKGVLATLWPVADQSTAIFMQELYRSRQADHLTKAEALRDSQLALINGTHKSSKGLKTLTLVKNVSSGTAPVFTPDPAKPYAHPYYWAPFILMGNWL